MLRQLIPGVFALFLTAGLLGCGDKKSHEHVTAYTKVDSLTEIYLQLQDSMLFYWNMMINDDNQKIKALGNVLHELEHSGDFDPEKLKSLSYRLDQLQRIRYTQKTLVNSDVVEEYDFASNSLITELVSLSEAYPPYAYNPTLRDLIEKIRLAEQRVAEHRNNYDAIAEDYNSFIEKNGDYLKEIDQSATLEKKPLFQMVSE